MKTKVEIIFVPDEYQQIMSKGDKGYIDGYLVEQGVVVAVVCSEAGRIIIAPIHCLKHIGITHLDVARAVAEAL